MNFADILKTKAAEVERPPLPPLGTYVWAVARFELGEVSSDKGEWDTVEFHLQATEPSTGVDPDELAAYGNIANVKTRLSFMFDRHDEVKKAQTLYRMTTFLTEHLGIEAGKKDLNELINESVGQSCLGVLKYRTAPSGDQFPEIGKTAPLE